MRHDPIRRRFLFLQGPPGPFFWQLAQALGRAGHATLRINLNGGDRRCWPGAATDYRGTLQEWTGFLDDYLGAHWITDLVLFGDCRPLHRAAHRLAQASGLAIHVFEEGYVRPDWVTLEPGGVNGHSTLPRDPDWYRAAAAALPPVPVHPPLPFSFRRRAWEAIGYYTSVTLGRPRFRGYRSHREHAPIVEGLGWLRRFVRGRGAAARSRAVLDTLGYTFNLARDVNTQIPPVIIDHVDPGDAIAASAGIGISFNQRTTLNLGYAHSWAFGTKTRTRLIEPTEAWPDMRTTKSRDLQIGRLLFGVTYRVTDRASLNWSVEVGATDDATYLRTTLRIPLVLLAGR